MESVFQEDFILEGNVKVSNGLAIKGRVVGDVKVDANIFIDKHASVIGNVESSESLYLLGELRGMCGQKPS